MRECRSGRAFESGERRFGSSAGGTKVHMQEQKTRWKTSTTTKGRLGRKGEGGGEVCSSRFSKVIWYRLKGAGKDPSQSRCLCGRGWCCCYSTAISSAITGFLPGRWAGRLVRGKSLHAGARLVPAHFRIWAWCRASALSNLRPEAAEPTFTSPNNHTNPAFSPPCLWQTLIGQDPAASSIGRRLAKMVHHATRCSLFHPADTNRSHRSRHVKIGVRPLFANTSANTQVPGLLSLPKVSWSEANDSRATSPCLLNRQSPAKTWLFQPTDARSCRPGWAETHPGAPGPQSTRKHSIEIKPPIALLFVPKRACRPFNLDPLKSRYPHPRS